MTGHSHSCSKQTSSTLEDSLPVMGGARVITIVDQDPRRSLTVSLCEAERGFSTLERSGANSSASSTSSLSPHSCSPARSSFPPLRPTPDAASRSASADTCSTRLPRPNRSSARPCTASSSDSASSGTPSYGISSSASSASSCTSGTTGPPATSLQRELNSNAIALAALVEHRDSLAPHHLPATCSRPPSATSRPTSVSSQNSMASNSSSSASTDTAPSPTEARARAAYTMYLDELIEARHYLAVLAYERRSRVFLVHEPVWTRHVLRASEEVELARVGYEAMRAEMELLDISV